MIKPRQLLPLVLPLAIAAASPLAQPDTPNGGEAAPGPADTTAETGQAAAGENTDTGQKPSPTRSESPFDYRPSEEISEDLPVSFPVDI